MSIRSLLTGGGGSPEPFVDYSAAQNEQDNALGATPSNELQTDEDTYNIVSDEQAVSGDSDGVLDDAENNYAPAQDDTNDHIGYFIVDDDGNFVPFQPFSNGPVIVSVSLNSTDLTSVMHASDVPVNSGTIVIVFDTAMDENAGSVTLTSTSTPITLSPGAWSETDVPNDTYTVSFDSSNNLSYETTYTINISGFAGPTDADVMVGTNTSFSFTTVNDPNAGSGLPAPDFTFPTITFIFGDPFPDYPPPGTGTTAGTWAWVTNAAMPSIPGDYVGVIFTPTNPANYDWTDVPGWNEAAQTVTRNVFVTVNPAAPPTLTLPTASNINYGQTLSVSTLSGGTAGIGTWAWADGNIMPNAGTGSLDVRFTPTNPGNHNWASDPTWENGAVTRQVEVAVAQVNLTYPEFLTTQPTIADSRQFMVGTAGTFDITPNSFLPALDTPDFSWGAGVPTFHWGTLGGDYTDIINNHAALTGAIATPDQPITITANTALANVGYSATIPIIIRSGNFYDFTITITVTITGLTPVTITGLEARQNIIFNGTGAQDDFVTGTPSFNGGSVTINDPQFTRTYFSGQLPGALTELSQAPRNAGIYTVRLTLNHPEFSGSQDVPFTIARRDVTISGTLTKPFDGSAAFPVANIGNALTFGAVSGSPSTGLAPGDELATVTVPLSTPITFASEAADLDNALIGKHNVTFGFAPEAGFGMNNADIDNYYIYAVNITGTVTQTFAPNRGTAATDSGIQFWTTPLSDPGGLTGWTNAAGGFVVTAIQPGYALSYYPTLAGTGPTLTGGWTTTLSHIDETPDGSMIIFVRRNSTGEISAAIPLNFSIERQAPTVQVQYNANESSGFRNFLNTITFGLFFRPTATVYIQGADTGAVQSGVHTVEYLLVNPAEVVGNPSEFASTATGWQPGAAASANTISTTIDLGRHALFARVTDNAGNQVIQYEGVVVFRDSYSTVSTTFVRGDTTTGEPNTNNLTVTVQNSDPTDNMNGNTVRRITYTGESGTIDLTSADFTSNPTTSQITFTTAFLMGLAARTDPHVLTVHYYPQGAQVHTDGLHPDSDIAAVGGDPLAQVGTTTIDITVSRAEQAPVTVNQQNNIPFGDPPTVTLAATGGSGTGNIVFTVEDTSPATLSGNTLTITGMGTVTVTAIREGDANFLDSTASAPMSFEVTAGQQAALAINEVTPLTYGAANNMSIELSVTDAPGSGGGTLTFNLEGAPPADAGGIQETAVARLNTATGQLDILGSTITGVYPVTTDVPIGVTVTRAAQGNFQASTSAVRNITVNRGSPGLPGGTPTVFVMFGSAQTYYFILNPLLPDIADNLEWGNVSFVPEAPTGTNPGIIIVSPPLAITGPPEARVLEITLGATTANQTATIPITINSDNFMPVTASVTVSITSGTPVYMSGLEALGGIYDATPFIGFRGATTGDANADVIFTTSTNDPPSYAFTALGLDRTYFRYVDADWVELTLPVGQEGPIDAGTYRIRLSIPDGHGYTGQWDFPFTIAQRPVSIIGDGLGSFSRPFDGTDRITELPSFDWATDWGALSFTESGAGGVPANSGLIAGQTATVDFSNVEARFASIEVGNGIGINFTERTPDDGLFAMTSGTADPNNYIISQPTAVTGDITQGFNPTPPATYFTTSALTNGWTNQDFVVTAANPANFQIGENRTAAGPWGNTITRTAQTDDSNTPLDFFVRNVATGEISQQVTVTYGIDHTPPTVEVQYAANAFRTFLNNATFGLFFRDNVSVTISAADTRSGVVMTNVQYLLLRDTAITETPDPNDAGWTNATAAFNITPTGRYILHVRATDNVGNASAAFDRGVIFADSQPNVTVSFYRGPDVNWDIPVNMNGNSVQRITWNGADLPANAFNATAVPNQITINSSFWRAADNLPASPTPHTLIVHWHPHGEVVVTPEAGSETINTTNIQLTASRSNQTAWTIDYTGTATVAGSVTLTHNADDVPSGSGAVTFAVLSGNANIPLSSNTLNITGAGHIEVQATRAADANFNEFTSDPITISVGLANQYPPLTMYPVGSQTFAFPHETITLSTTGGSGDGAVSFQLVSGMTAPTVITSSSVATLSGNQLTITGAGTVYVRAQKAGDDNYNMATSEPISIQVAQYGPVTPAVPQTRYVAMNQPDTIELDMSALFPTNWFAAAGTVTFTPSIQPNNNIYGVVGTIDSNPTSIPMLSVPILSIDQPGRTATISVSVASANFQTFIGTFTIETIDRQPVNPAHILVGAVPGAVVNAADRTITFPYNRTERALPLTSLSIAANQTAVYGTLTFSVVYTNTASPTTGPVNANVSTPSTVRITAQNDTHAGFVDWQIIITPLQLTWSAQALNTVNSRLFNQGTVATVSNAPTLVGVITGDIVSVQSGTVAFANANVGNNIAVTGSGWGMQSTVDATNYIAPATQPLFAPANITPIQLTWNNDGTVQSRPFNGGTSATVDNLPTLNGVLTGCTVTVTPASVAFSSINAGTGIPINASSWGIAGAGAGNYTAPIAQPVFTPGTITQAAVVPTTTTTIPSPTGNAFDVRTATNYAALAALVGLPSQVNFTLAYGGTITNVPVTWAATPAFNPRGVTYNFTATLAPTPPQDQNVSFALANPITSTVTITPVVAPNPAPIADIDAVRNSDFPAATAADLVAMNILPSSINISVQGQTIPFIITWEAQTIDMTEIDAVQTFTGTISHDAAAHPWLTPPANQNVNRIVRIIDRIPLTFNPASVQDAVYSGAAWTFTGTPTFTTPAGAAATVTIADFNLLFEAVAPTPAWSAGSSPHNAGSYTVRISLDEAHPRYTFETLYVPFTITQRPITLVANNATVAFGAAMPTFTFGVTNLAPNQTVANALSEMPTLTGPADTNTAGEHPITLTGGVATANYTITERVNGTLTVQAPPPTPTPTPAPTPTPTPPPPPLPDPWQPPPPPAPPSTPTPVRPTPTPTPTPTPDNYVDVEVDFIDGRTVSLRVGYNAATRTATLDLDEDTTQELIDNAFAVASDYGTAPTVELNLTTVRNATNAQISIEALTQVADAGIGLTVRLPEGTITLDTSALATAVEDADGYSLVVTLTEVGRAPLTTTQLDAVELTDLVFEITITAGNRYIRNFGGTLTVSVPYSGELAPTVWYLDDIGEMHYVESEFSPADELVTFTTTHLSKYVLRSDYSDAAIETIPEEPPITERPPVVDIPIVTLPLPIEPVEPSVSPMQAFIDDHGVLLLIIAISAVALFGVTLIIHLIYRKRTRYIVS